MEPSRRRRLKLLLLLALLMAFASARAADAGTAGTNLPWNRPLDVVVGNLTGPTGKILAVAAIVIVGLAWAFGRSDEGLSTAGKAMIGIGCLLGAPALIDLLGFEGAVVPEAEPASLPFPALAAGAALLATALVSLLIARSSGSSSAD
jgi:type IV secretory pathway VirB2 component (pilin)